MRILVVMTSLGAGILASSAFAADVSIKGNAGETLEASNNYFLINTPSGPTIKSLTAGTLDILARTPTTNFLLDTNYSYYKYFGPGAADTSLKFGTPASATFSVDHTEQLTKYNAAASWTRSDAATTNLAQTGNAVGRGSIETAAINGGLAHDLGRNDTLTWTAQASKVTFTDPTQFPYIDVVSTAGWQHTVSSTTTLNNFVSFDWFSEDNPAQSQRLFWKIMTGIDSKLTPRLSFVGHVGVGLVNSYQTAGQSTSALNVNNINPPGVGHRYFDSRCRPISAPGRNRHQHFGRPCTKLPVIEDNEFVVDSRTSGRSNDIWSTAEKRFDRNYLGARHQSAVQAVVFSWVFVCSRNSRQFDLYRANR